MRLLLILSTIISVVVAPAIIFANSIVLKNGHRVESEKCWEQGDLIVCRQYGATVGYQKSNIAEVIKISKDTNKLERDYEKSDNVDAYRLKIAYKVQKEWSYDERLAGGRDLNAGIVFKVLPDGRVKDIELVDPSDDEMFNQSAYSAVKNAVPFPRHPLGISRPFVELGLRFSPSGIR